ncbi:hypothetical protein B0H17DRAFT_1046323, partial [Mycena rosella]
RWREARKRPPPSTLEEFMSKAERERVLDKAYGHRNSDSTGSMGSMGPLLADAPAAASRASRALSSPCCRPTRGATTRTTSSTPAFKPAPHRTPAPLPHPTCGSPSRRPPPSPPRSGPTTSPPRRRPPPPPPPPSPCTPSAPRPRACTPSTSRPPRRPELPPETPPLERGNTRAVAELLKSRAKRVSDAPQRSMTRTSRIERADSIREAPSPSPSPSPSSFSPSSFYGTTDSAAFTDTLEYYSHPTDPGDDDAMSVSSYDTVRPTKSAR